MTTINKDEIVNELNQTLEMANLWGKTTGGIEDSLTIALQESLSNIATKLKGKTPLDLSTDNSALDAASYYQPVKAPEVTNTSPQLKQTAFGYSSQPKDDNKQVIKFDGWEDMEIQYGGEYEQYNHTRRSYVSEIVPMPFSISNEVNGRRVAICFKRKGVRKNFSTAFNEEKDLQTMCRNLVAKLRKAIQLSVDQELSNKGDEK